MAVAFQDIGERLRRICLSGRLDLAATEAVANELAALCASPQRRVVLDMSAVSFISSIGIRALVVNAKVQHALGGKLVVQAAAGGSVARILETTGVDLIVPVFFDAAAAEAAVLG
ncbi:MAG TPA: STAS domain-containing protein [Rhodocyclaceae bacterium]